MQNKGEAPIIQTYFCQITPQRYTLSETNFEFNYTTNQRIFANTINLTNFAIYNQFTNVNAIYNSFQIFINGYSYQVTIPEINYNFWDIFDLQTIIATQLNAQVPIGVWTVTLGGNNNKFSIITNSTTPFRLVYGGSPAQQQILRYLGFSSAKDPSFSQLALSHQSVYPYAVQVTQNMNIQIKNTANLFSDTIGVIAQVPLNAPIQTGNFWQSPYYQFARHIISPKEHYPIYNFQIQILDDNGFPMDLSGQRMSATIVFEQFALG